MQRTEHGGIIILLELPVRGTSKRAVISSRARVPVRSKFDTGSGNSYVCDLFIPRRDY